jgi:hypothetical protein
MTARSGFDARPASRHPIRVMAWARLISVKRRRRRPLQRARSERVLQHDPPLLAEPIGHILPDQPVVLNHQDRPAVEGICHEPCFHAVYLENAPGSQSFTLDRRILLRMGRAPLRGANAQGEPGA